MYKIQYSSTMGKWQVINTDTNKIHSRWQTGKQAEQVAADLKRFNRLMEFYPRLAELNKSSVRK